MMKIISNNIKIRQKIISHLSVIDLPIAGRLIVSHDGKSHVLKIENILFCEAEGNYTTIQLCDGRSMLESKCLKYIVAKLPNTHFVRIHQSFLVNLNYVEAVGFDSVGMENHPKSLPLSRKYKKSLRYRLGC